jgi:ribosomal protein S13
MAAELVRLVQSRNGKFLKEEGSVWSQVPDNIARRKVANCFRTTRHRKKKIANNSNTAG